MFEPGVESNRTVYIYIYIYLHGVREVNRTIVMLGWTFCPVIKVQRMTPENGSYPTFSVATVKPF